MARKSKRQTDRERWIRDEVRDILAMFGALRKSYEAIPDKSGIEEDLIIFDGFDANDEEEYEYLRAARQIAIATRGAEVPNSHGARLRTYQMMLQSWRSSRDKENLTKEDILRVLGR